MDKRKRQRIIWRKANENRCAHCGKVCYTNRTVDHYIPRSEGGTGAYANLMPLCEDCNRRRNSAPVNPFEYYQFAKPDAITECYKYGIEFKANYSTM